MRNSDEMLDKFSFFAAVFCMTCACISMTAITLMVVGVMLGIVDF